MSISVDNQTDFVLPIDRLEDISNFLTSKEVELIVTDSRTIREINSTHRAKDSATDVLSFPIDGDFDGLPLGSIVISIDFVYEKSKLFGHSDGEELILLFIHGILHLLGFDHEVDSGEMRAKEESLIAKFNLPTSLIVRG